ncbi:MAG: methyltransferase domain-containing protein [Candidatus Rokuibacteriota bacterium]
MTAIETPGAAPPLLVQNLAILMCPACGGALELDGAGAGIACRACGRVYANGDGIPRLFWPTGSPGATDVTDIVKAFYEETPFPNYDDLDSPEQLRAKAEQGHFARLLNEQIPHGSRVLECGCGTGQLSNFLGLTWGRTVFGTDLCINSLTLGHRFRQAHDVKSVGFLQMNLFRPAFRPESFDVVISNGVLHHTGDPRGGFASILRCLRPGGFIIIGLYNTYGRKKA